MQKIEEGSYLVVTWTTRGVRKQICHLCSCRQEANKRYALELYHWNDDPAFIPAIYLRVDGKWKLVNGVAFLSK